VNLSFRFFGFGFIFIGCKMRANVWMRGWVHVAPCSLLRVCTPQPVQRTTHTPQHALRERAAARLNSSESTQRSARTANIQNRPLRS
jgi:hypothetical protein